MRLIEEHRLDEEILPLISACGKARAGGAAGSSSSSDPDLSDADRGENTHSAENPAGQRGGPAETSGRGGGAPRTTPSSPSSRARPPNHPRTGASGARKTPSAGSLEAIPDETYVLRDLVPLAAVFFAQPEARRCGVLRGAALAELSRAAFAENRDFRARYLAHVEQVAFADFLRLVHRKRLEELRQRKRDLWALTGGAGGRTRRRQLLAQADVCRALSIVHQLIVVP